MSSVILLVLGLAAAAGKIDGTWDGACKDSGYCPADQYQKNSAHSSDPPDCACSDCPDGSQSPDDSSQGCNDCPAGQVLGTDLDDAFSLIYTTCEPCESGYFSLSGECTACWTGSEQDFKALTPAAGATSMDECTCGDEILGWVREVEVEGVKCVCPEGTVCKYIMPFDKDTMCPQKGCYTGFSGSNAAGKPNDVHCGRPFPADTMGGQQSCFSNSDYATTCMGECTTGHCALGSDWATCKEWADPNAEEESFAALPALGAIYVLIAGQA